MTRKQLISIFFIALLLYILYSVFHILSPFMLPIFWAAMLAFAFYPLYSKFLSLFRKNAILASLLTTMLVLLAFVPLVIFVLLHAAKEAIRLYDWLVENIQNGRAEYLLLSFRQLDFVKKMEGFGLIRWESIQTQWKDWAMNSAGGIGNFALTHATSLTKNMISGLFSFFLTFFLLFFFLRDGERVYRFIYEITPLDDDHKKVIFKQLSDTFSATLRGQLFTALAQAGTLGIVFWVMGLPLPVLFTAIAFLAAMIPVFGAATVWVPFVLYLAINQEFTRAGLLFVLGIFVISGIDNVLKPLLIGQKTKLPYSLLFLGILGGLQVYGFIGVFLAPAVLSLFFVLVKIYKEKFSEPAP